MDYGEIYQQIRKGKGMTLKEASYQVLSPSQLSRFENGLSMVPADLFQELLRNINTTPEEFFFLLGMESEQELRAFFFQTMKYNETQDYEKLKELRDKLTKERPSSYNWGRFFILFLDCLINVNENRETNPQPVLDYLMQVEDWGEMELRLYAIFSFVLAPDTLYHLMKTALKKSQLYQSIPQDLNVLYAILTNNFSAFLFHDRLDYAEETLRIFEERYAANLELLGPHLDFRFNRALLHLVKEEGELSRKYYQETIQACQQFQQSKREQMYASRYKSWVENFGDPEFNEVVIKLGFWTSHLG